MDYLGSLWLLTQHAVDLMRMLKIGFVGDINPGEYYTSLGHGPRRCFDEADPLTECKHLLLGCDTVVGNLEAPVTDRARSGRNYFDWGLLGNVNSIIKLKGSNFGYLSVSNNHSVQHGEKIFAETISMLNQNGIVPLGLKSQELTVILKDDISVGILAASDVLDNTDKKQQLYQVYNQDFLEKIKSCINKVDHIVVFLHWGDEASTVPTLRQREIAGVLREMGVSAVIGSHSHLFYPIEMEESFICAYSLGNFIFDLAWEQRLTRSGILAISFEKKSLSAEITPLQLTDHGCIPRIAGDTKSMKGNVNLYNNGQQMKNQQFKKIIYLLRYIHKGKTLLKLKFLKSKIIK